MADPKRKMDTIRSIQNLQLSTALIIGLNDAKQAESIAEPLRCLQDVAEQWN